MTPQIYLRKGKEESLMRRHPWIFSGAIDYIKAEDESEIAEGALVEVYTRSGEFIAQGHYQIGSIAVLAFFRKEKRVPFGPAIAAACFIMILYGEKLTGWYTGLF